jgi:adenylate cyclase
MVEQRTLRGRLPSLRASVSQTPRVGRRVKLPITSTLLLGFGGLVAIAVASVMLISIRVAQENTDQLQQQTATQRLDAAIARIDRYLTPVADDVAFLALQLSRPGIELGDDTQIETLMRGSLGAAPQIAGLAFIRNDLTSVRTRRGRQRDRIDSLAGSIADRSHVLELIEAAKRLPGVGWNDVFYVQELGVSFVSAMAPVRRGDKFAGTFVAAVPVPQLSNLIDSGDPGSTIFILDAGDGVVAHPLLAHGSFRPTASHFLPRRLELADPVLRALWSPEAGASRLGTRLAGTSNWVRRVEADGNAHVVLLRLVKDFSVQPWIVGIYFPATQLLGPITRLRLAIAVGLLILACGVALALLLGRSLARPIRRLALAAEAVSAFDFSGARAVGSSPLRELDSAGRAWDSMLAALRWFETYVHKALVGRLLQESAEGALKAEEREVTVMFTDIAGFSKIALGRSPVALGAFLNRHFALLGREVEAQQGTIDKYIGDSIMAFWGAPAVDSKHAEHAVRAALGAAEALAADNRRRAKKGLRPIRLRIGLHSGPAIVGNVGAPGRVNYTLIGDTVNAAQRLEQLGKAFDDGRADCIVLASAATVDALPGDIPRRALGEQSLRGMGSFKVYRLG